jgi:hypothetical protein
LRIFKARDKHSRPPTVTAYESWRAPYPEMAHEVSERSQIGRRRRMPDGRHVLIHAM